MRERVRERERVCVCVCMGDGGSVFLFNPCVLLGLVDSCIRLNYRIPCNQEICFCVCDTEVNVSLRRVSCEGTARPQLVIRPPHATLYIADRLPIIL